MQSIGIFLDVRLNNLLQNSRVVDAFSRYNATSDSDLDRIYLRQKIQSKLSKSHLQFVSEIYSNGLNKVCDVIVMDLACTP